MGIVSIVFVIVFIVLFNGWEWLGVHFFFGGVATNLPFWYDGIGVALIILVFLLIAKLIAYFEDGHGGGHYTPDGYPGWWNRSDDDQADYGDENKEP